MKDLNPPAIVSQVEDHEAALIAKIRSNLKNSMEANRIIGEALIEAKRLYGSHGRWGQWLKKNVTCSRARVTQCMKLAKKLLVTSNLTDKDKEKLWQRIQGNAPKPKALPATEYPSVDEMLDLALQKEGIQFDPGLVPSPGHGLMFVLGADHLAIESSSDLSRYHVSLIKLFPEDGEQSTAQGTRMPVIPKAIQLYIRDWGAEDMVTNGERREAFVGRPEYNRWLFSSREET